MFQRRNQTLSRLILGALFRVTNDLITKQKLLKILMVDFFTVYKTFIGQLKSRTHT